MFNQYPYLNINDLNLDYLLKAIKEMRNEVTNFVSINAIKYADPIQWDITRQYEKNTVVIDPLTGTAYISVAPVPSGVLITRTEFWTVVFDLGMLLVKSAKNFTDHYESSLTYTATFPSNVNDWLVWGEELYVVISPIIAGDQYVVDSNIRRINIENTIGHLSDLTTTNKDSIVDAINEISAEVLGKIGDLNDLTTLDKTTIVNAINSLKSMVVRVLGLPDLEKATTFDSNYSAGTLILWWDTIYRITSNVNAGDPIVVGTNVMGENIGGIITAIYNEFSNVNTAITNVDNKIGDLSNLTTNDHTNVVNAINEVNKDVTRLKHRKFVFIGDSWNTTATPQGGVPIVPWNNYVRLYMGIDAGDYYNIGWNGSGFSGGRKYLELLQEEIDPQIDDKSEITDIVVLGGLNDIYHLNDLWDDMNAFRAHVNTNYPNALLTVGMCEWTTDPAINKLLKQVYAYYLNMVGKNCRVIPHAFAAAHCYQYYQPDGGHLNGNGSNHLGEFIANYLNHGGMTAWDGVNTAWLSLDSTVVASAGTNIVTSQLDQTVIARLNVDDINLTSVNTVAPLTAYKIGDIGKYQLCGIDNKNVEWVVPCYYHDGTYYHNIDVEFYLLGFELYFKVLTVDENTGTAPLNTTKITGGSVSKNFSIFDC